MLFEIIYASGLIDWIQWARKSRLKLIRARPFTDEDRKECYEMMFVKEFQ